ncbi:50S ribosomal protein L13 [Candidatus Saccharibacteria bacterium]|nr:50S ribosomal protein L13 [Candidatus Saccharibacteria bacterium]
MPINSHKKTYSHKPADINRAWWLVDASTAPLGHLSTMIADKLMGKSKVTFTPHVDDGDYVVVINASKVIATGNKDLDKKYYRHTGYPGGIKETSLGKLRAEKPEFIIENAVKGMLPKNKLQAERLKRLRVFAGEEHSHTAQTPVKLEVK